MLNNQRKNINDQEMKISNKKKKSKMNSKLNQLLWDLHGHRYKPNAEGLAKFFNEQREL